MKQKLLSVTVASALGLGVMGYAQAQALEGCKAYITGEVLNIRLVNPVSNNLVTALGGASAQGSNTAGIVFPTDNATQGDWNTVTNTFDADPACISDIGGVAVDQGFPCPPNNTFGQILPFEDFGRADSLDVPAPDPGANNGAPDVNIDSDDFTLGCGAQRSFTNQLKSANGNSTNQVLAVRILLADGEPDTQFLEWRGDYSGAAEAIVSREGSAAAISTANFEVERLSDGARITCNTDAIELAAEVTVGPGADGPVTIPGGTVIECDAEDFPAGTQQVFSHFQADGVTEEQYDVSAAYGCNANCTLFPEGDGVYKWYFGKQIGPFDEDNPELQEPINVAVNLKDQFDDRDYSVRSLRGLQTPAGKDSEVDPAREGHLSCWGISALAGQGIAPRPEVDFTTANFGNDTIPRLISAPELCVTASKEFPKDTGNVEFDPTLPSYKCYSVGIADAINEDHFLDDQFDFDEADPRTIRRLSRFCAPVTVDGGAPPVVVEDPSDPETWQHLACYELPVKSLFPNFLKAEVADQFILDQLGQDIDFTVERELRMCEPAIKTAVDGVPLIP